MSLINLLPWRQQQRRRAQQRYIGLFVLGLTLICAIQGHRYRHYQHRYKHLQQQLEALPPNGHFSDQTVQLLNVYQQQLQQQQTIIRQQQQRLIAVINALTTTIPQNIYLQTFTLLPSNIVIAGTAASTTAINPFFNRLSRQLPLQKIIIDKLHSIKSGMEFEFKVERGNAH